MIGVCLTILTHCLLKDNDRESEKGSVNFKQMKLTSKACNDNRCTVNTDIAQI